MRLIVLETITASHFRAITDTATLEFPAGGLIYLTGVNELDPSLGSNGAGKSTWWDALTWCLYGMSIRGQRASELMPWGTKHRPQVIACYTIDGVQYAIERIGSPERLTINGSEVPQAAVDELMGLPRARFVHSVVFGQAAPLFMDLTVPQRGEMLAELMMLDYWESMSDFAGNKAKKLSFQMEEATRQISHREGQLTSSQSHLTQTYEAERVWMDGRDEQVAQWEANYDAAEATLNQCTELLAYAEAWAAEIPQSLPIEHLISRRAHLRSEQEHIKQQHQATLQQSFFYRDNHRCPTCGQNIAEHFRVAKLTELSEDVAVHIANLDSSKQESADVEDRYAKAQAINRAYEQTQNEIRQAVAFAQADVRLAKNNHDMAHKTLVAVLEQTNPFTRAIAQAVTQVHNLQADIAARKEARIAVETEFMEATYWRKHFLNIRLFIIRRLLKVLEIETAAAAGSLGVGDWHITFSTEVETKSGNTSSRFGVYAHVTNPRKQGDYRSYSYGEAQRIKLAVSLGLSALVQSMSGVYHSIEVFDEPTQWLSPQGVEHLMSCLDDRAESTGKTIWLSDHHTLSYPFAETWQVTKDQHGTSIEKIA